MPNSKKSLKIRRALLTVSDKEGVAELARALSAAGAEIIATGKTAQVIEAAGVAVTPIEKVSGAPEAFQGRMKTLSFPVCSGILYRRGDASDEADLGRLALQAIDCVVVNFYPFEKAAAAAEQTGTSRAKLIEEIDIGGPTLVRAAAKNSPSVLVLTAPRQYRQVIEELQQEGGVSTSYVDQCASEAWDRILAYDAAIARRFGSAGHVVHAHSGAGQGQRVLRYGENPHQKGTLRFDADSPIGWGESLTPTELSYNNILDLSAAYALACDLVELDKNSTGVVIVKHNNPCGVALVPKSVPQAQKMALLRAWEGDPVSAFGGVLVFTDPIGEEAASWLAERFVELVAAPDLSAQSPGLLCILAKRKNLKAIPIHRFGGVPAETQVVVPGGTLIQTSDVGIGETFRSVTRRVFSEAQTRLGRFGVAVCRASKSNAIVLVRELPSVPGVLQLVGAGQGQPNRVDALRALAVPRAQAVLRESGGSIGDCLMVSDAFFPFRDTVDTAHGVGIRSIIQPGGSIKDGESIAACDEHEMVMAFTGIRHFRH